MAYLSFSSLDGACRTASATDAGEFSPVELRVIDLAERIDATSERIRGTRLASLMERLLGIRLPAGLADPRLESLRRFASLARHHPEAVGDADIRALVEAGYSLEQACGLANYLSVRAGR